MNYSRSLCQLYEEYTEIILYGSVARHAATEDSDIDIAFFVKDDDPEMHDKMLDVIVELNLEYDQLISPSMIEIEKFEKWKNVLPYYINIEKEGIVLWKAAERIWQNTD